MTHYLKLLTFAMLITAFSAHCNTEIEAPQQEKSEKQKSNATIIKKHMISAISEICGWASLISGVVSISGAVEFILDGRLSRNLYIALPLTIVLSRIPQLCRELTNNTN